MKRISAPVVLVFLSIVLMSLTIDLQNLDNYANQFIPDYILKQNTPPNNPTTDAGATLGRVLFYDKKLSVNNTIACASCHKQEFAFSDTSLVSTGVNGVTGRHAMRLINPRFSVERRFFWDERANTLEEQTTMPIQDHSEMGYSGQNGDPGFADLLDKLDKVPYYNDLFKLAFGDTMITENRMQRALAQFVRSIQSFDSKYDAGRSMSLNDQMPFPNFTQQENMGKNLFLAPPVFNPMGERVGGGAGCAGCHGAPEFDIAPNSQNNGVTLTVNGEFDPTVTRSPSLRDLIRTDGVLNGPMMHNGVMKDLGMVIDHYNDIMPDVMNQNLDPKLRPNGFPQKLNLTNQERTALIAFLRTLSGTDVYTNPIWSNPFDPDGSITILNGTTAIDEPQITASDIRLFPNPASSSFTLSGLETEAQISLMSTSGQLLQQVTSNGDDETLIISDLPAGVYMVVVQVPNQQKRIIKKLIKQ
ncbi:MAG: cytochrome c peroxidase [Saprospiraceae bacterium]